MTRKKPAGDPELRSERAVLRQRKRVAAIVEDALNDLRAAAPFQQIRRLVASRCAAQGLPAPSRHALVAKIAEVRRHATATKTIVLDRCIIETPLDAGGTALFSLCVALLHPPGRPLAWRLIAGRAQPAVDATLVRAVQDMSSGSATDTNVMLASTGPVARRIRECLADARVATIARASGDRGADARSALTRHLSPSRIRLRAPRAGARATWAEQTLLSELSARVDSVLGGRLGRIRNPPAFGLASPRLGSDLMDRLAEIEGADASAFR